MATTEPSTTTIESATRSVISFPSGTGYVERFHLRCGNRMVTVSALDFGHWAASEPDINSEVHGEVCELESVTIVALETAVEALRLGRAVASWQIG